jgi:hypothetical protein
MTCSSDSAVVTGPTGSNPSVSIPEWVRLSSEEVNSYVARCGSASDNHAVDTTKILGLFQDDCRPTFYRRDLSSILKGLGYDAKTIGYGGSGDRTLEAIHALCTKADGKRSWWILNAPASLAKGPLKPVQIELPEPVEEELKHPTTLQWFEQQIRDNALDRKCAHLLRRKRPEESFEEMLSHVGYWFAKWGAEGHCDKFIADGKPPTVSILTHWLEHKFSHAEYRRAKDALHRESGKRTQSEIRHRRFLGEDDYISPGAERTDPEAHGVAWKSSGDDDDDSMEREFVSHPEEPLSDLLDEEELSLARDVIRVCRARAADRYARFMDHLFSGLSKQEAAELEECTELRVTHMYQRVRDDLRAAPILIEVALKVLDVISEEPWSTKEEIEAEMPSPDLDRALKLLQIRGLMTEGSGHAFAPTDAGRNAVQMGSLI